MAGGRPTKYFDSFTKENEKLIIESYEQGKTDIAAMVILDIVRDTFYRWLKEEDKKEFSDIIEKGRLRSQSWWEDKGKDGIGNKDMNTGVYCFSMRGRFKKDYGEEQKDINITNVYQDVNVPTRMSADEWIKNQESKEDKKSN